MNTIKISGIFLLSVFALQGCAPANYNVKHPVPSDAVYSSSSKLELSINDQRPDSEKVFSYGILKANLLINKKPLEPIEYIKEHTNAELKARGIDVNSKDMAEKNLAITKTYIKNHRTNGYAPFVTFSMLSATLKTPTETEKIGIFIKRGKVPVWSFDEVIEPAFNEPLSLLVKELAAKINSLTVNQSISDEKVKELIKNASVKPVQPNTYLKVYELGFGNNKNAIKSLVEFTKHEDEYIRIAAISSLGILKADSELPYLKSLYSSQKLWQDRAMALKAICDIGTPEALGFAASVKKEFEKTYQANTKDQEAAWTLEVLSLYI